MVLKLVIKLLIQQVVHNLTELTNGTSYFAKVVDANTFSLASSFANATSDTPTLLSFGEETDMHLILLHLL